MAFAPVVPFGGLTGFRFVDRTYQAQFETFGRSPDIQREIDYFLDNAGKVATAAELVADRRLLRVALGAFGLEAEADKSAFVRRVLEDGVIDPRALANRLSDPAWVEFSSALGFGDLGGLLGFEATRLDLAARYRVRAFEVAIGESDVDIRLAFNFRREIAAIASDPDVENSGWFKIMGSRPLRAVVEGAFGLPAAFAQLDIDRQREELEARSQRMFGDASPAVFAASEAVDTLLRRFLVTAQAAQGLGAAVPGATALTLLQASPLGAAGSANLFASNL